jgi:microcystin-dependent protein
MSVTTPLYLQKKLIPARFDRQHLGDLFRKGVVAAGDLAVTPNGSTNVSVAKGAGYIPGNQNADQGVYRLFNDAALNLTHNAAVTNPRMDSIIMRIQDSTESNGVGPDIGSLEIAQGTESATVNQYNRSGGVVDVNLPVNSVIIADVIVRPGQPIAAADVIDRRLLALLKADPGDVKFAMRVVDPLGWKSSIGQAVSRVQYADVLSQISFVRAANTSIASATISGLSTTADLAAGMGVTGVGIPPGAYIQTIINSTSIQLNVNAAATGAAVSLTFYTATGPAFNIDGTTTNATNTLIGLSSTADLYVGMPLSASSGIPAGTVVASITSGTAITMSANATSSGTRTVTFQPHGAGDGSGTFNLPDMRGQVLIGAGVSPTLTLRPMGVVLGKESQSQQISELPPHGHPILTRTGTLDVTAQQMSAEGDANDGVLNAFSGRTTNRGGGPTANTNTTGSGNSMNVMQPSRAARPLIYTGVPF